MRREKAAAAGLEQLFLDDGPEGALRVGPAQEEVPVALDVRHDDAGLLEAARGVEKSGDRRRFEVRMGDEVLEDVAEQSDRAGPPPLRGRERCEKRLLVPGAAPHVAVGEHGAHCRYDSRDRETRAPH